MIFTRVPKTLNDVKRDNWRSLGRQKAIRAKASAPRWCGWISDMRRSQMKT